MEGKRSQKASASIAEEASKHKDRFTPAKTLDQADRRSGKIRSTHHSKANINFAY